MQDVLIPEKGWIELLGNIKIPAKQGLLFSSIGKIAIFFGRKEVPDIFKLMYIQPRVFWSWLYFASRMMPYGKLSSREREIIILRVGWLCRCRYEWGQHVEIGLRSGLEDQDIIHIAKGVDAFDDEKERALIQACNDFIESHMVSQETIEVLQQYYTDQLLLEILLLIGHYQMLAGIINSAGLNLEASAEQVMTDFNLRIAEEH